MSRPTYETERDRYRARRLADKTAEQWGLGQPFEMPPFAPYDFALVPIIGTEVAGFLEVKSREYHSGAFETYFVGLDKWQGLRELNAATGLPAILLFGFTDGARFLEVSSRAEVVPNFRIGGRADRGDPADATVVAHIPRAAFRHPSESNPFKI
jgi:hypothetical protein